MTIDSYSDLNENEAWVDRDLKRKEIKTRRDKLMKQVQSQVCWHLLRVLEIREGGRNTAACHSVKDRSTTAMEMLQSCHSFHVQLKEREICSMWLAIIKREERKSRGISVHTNNQSVQKALQQQKEVHAWKKNEKPRKSSTFRPVVVSGNTLPNSEVSQSSWETINGKQFC